MLVFFSACGFDEGAEEDGVGEEFFGAKPVPAEDGVVGEEDDMTGVDGFDLDGSRAFHEVLIGLRGGSGDEWGVGVAKGIQVGTCGWLEEGSAIAHELDLGATREAEGEGVSGIEGGGDDGTVNLFFGAAFGSLVVGWD